MASIRRTLSPVPRQGTLITGEVCSVASPLSKSSSCSHNHPSSGGLLSSLFGLLDSQAPVHDTFSPRWSRPVDRSKPRGPVWTRAVLHSFVCFMFGVFVGVTSFISWDLSISPTSKHQAFSFGIAATAGDIHGHDHLIPNMTSMMYGAKARSDEPKVGGQSVDRFSYEIQKYQSLPQDIGQEFGKLLIIVTPTNAWPTQAYYLNRLAYALKLVRTPLLWIVVEWSAQSDETADILRRTGVMYRHLVCKKNETEIKDRTIHQRNMALSHIETHHLDGIVYFADEENIYSADLFKQMLDIRRFGTWLVAKQTMIESEATVEGPVCNGTQVIGWHTNDPSSQFRRFHAGLSGFAFNSTILWDPKRWHRTIIEPIRHIDTVKDELRVSLFIQQVVEDENQMEGLPEGCSKVMVWHPNHVPSISFYPQKWFLKNNLDVVAPLE